MRYFSPVSLSTVCLVFPAAVGRLEVTVKIKREMTSRPMTGAVLAGLYNCLENCPLVSSLSYKRDVFSASELSLHVTPSAKWGKHFSLEVAASLYSSSHRVSLQSQLDSVTSQPPYIAACTGHLLGLVVFVCLIIPFTALEIWRRQFSLVLPPNLLPTLLLHCHETNIITNTSKSWQILKKVWTLLGGLDLSGEQLILGLSSAVPAASGECPPLLDRDGQTPLFPGLARPQWAALVQHARRSVSQSVELSLLTTVKPNMIYDRIYQVAGEVEVFSLMTNLARALGDRVTLLAIVKADTSKGSQLSMEVGVKYQPDLYWKPLSIGI